MGLRRFILTVLESLFLCSIAAPGWPALVLPYLIGDHMVIQAGKPGVLWGKDNPGQKVVVTLAGESGSTQADSKGKWKVKLASLRAGGPYELTIQGSATAKIEDVLVGEVWVGAGQSNMEFPMSNTHDSAKTLPQATDSKIRIFKQSLRNSTKPLDDPQGEWKVCTPDTIKDFSAVAYHFGLNLRKKLNVPVGLIQSCWGGTYIESWIPEKTFQTGPACKNSLKRWEAKPSWEKKMWAQGSFDADFWLSGLRFRPRDSTRSPVTVQFNGNALSRQEKTIPGYWSTGVKDGSEIDISTENLPGPVPGPLGHMTGKLLPDAWGWITTPLAKDGKTLDLTDFEAIEFYGRGSGKYILFLSQPTISDWDNYRTQAFETGNKWKLYRIPLSSLKQSGWGKARPFTPGAIQNIYFGIDPKPMAEMPSQLYDGMIHPLTSYPIRGVIWYQGEQNTSRAKEYHGLLASLIGGWRKEWREPDMPFIFAQLPGFMDTKDLPSESDWADLREQQSRTLSVPNTGMAVLIDLGEDHDIHPKNKTEVGRRLALVALEKAYGMKGPYLSPLYESAMAEGNRIRVTFKNAEEGLKSSGAGSLKGFAVAGRDGKFKWAQAEIKGNTVVVWNDQVADPKAIRYAWGDNPLCNLNGNNGLPASPFQAKLKDSKSR